MLGQLAKPNVVHGSKLSIMRYHETNFRQQLNSNIEELQCLHGSTRLLKALLGPKFTGVKFCHGSHPDHPRLINSCGILFSAGVGPKTT